MWDCSSPRTVIGKLTSSSALVCDEMTACLQSEVLHGWVRSPEALRASEVRQAAVHSYDGINHATALCGCDSPSPAPDVNMRASAFLITSAARSSAAVWLASIRFA